MSVEWTAEELLTIAEWATKKADKAWRGNLRNVHLYEIADSIYKKAIDLYNEMEKERKNQYD